MQGYGGWIAQLSDGSTIVESEPVPGERTPWQLLLQRCRESELKITGMRLQFGNVTVMAMPYKECDGYYQAIEVHRKNFISNNPIEVRRQGVGSVVGDSVYITWVEIKDGQLITRSDVRPLEGSLIHTTLS